MNKIDRKISINRRSGTLSATRKDCKIASPIGISHNGMKTNRSRLMLVASNAAKSTRINRFQPSCSCSNQRRRSRIGWKSCVISSRCPSCHLRRCFCQVCGVYIRPVQARASSLVLDILPRFWISRVSFASSTLELMSHGPA